MRECWEWLDKTSRSFSMVIKELDGDLARVVSASVMSGVRPADAFRVRYASSISFSEAWTPSRTI